jgi:glutamine synthetase
MGGPEPWNPRDTLDKPCYDAIGMLESLDFLNEMVGYMNTLGWDVHSFDHEDGNGQYELDFSYTDAVGWQTASSLPHDGQGGRAQSRLRGHVYAQALA